MAGKRPARVPTITPERISQRLSEGEDAQTLMAELITTSLGNEFYLNSMLMPMEILIKAGARVATGEPGCAFDVLIEKIGVNKPLLLSDLTKYLLSVPGEIPLHMIARGRPGILTEDFFADLKPEVLAGMHRRDDQGRTPSHWLWAPDGLLAGQAAAARAAQGDDASVEEEQAKRWVITVRQVWQAQDRLQALGIGLEIPDHDGVVAFKLCQSRLAAEDTLLFPSYAICRMAKAHQDGLDMSAATPLAPMHKAAARL